MFLESTESIPHSLKNPPKYGTFSINLLPNKTIFEKGSFPLFIARIIPKDHIPCG